MFEKGLDREIITSTAIIGIRGTACFLNVNPYATYFCTCYGKTEFRAKGVRDELRQLEAYVGRVPLFDRA